MPPVQTRWPIAAGIAVGVLVTLSGLSGGMSPFTHSVCSRGALLSEVDYRWAPAILVNSPYLGAATGNYGATWSLLGGSVSPGSGSAAATEVGYFNTSLYQTANSSSLGPGVSSRCAHSHEIVLGAIRLYGAGSVNIPLPSNVTDRGEANSLQNTSWAGNISREVRFNNGFTNANVENRSTCGLGSISLTVIGRPATVDLAFNISGSTVFVPFALPFPETFTYTFPANGGTWAIDDLSAPGGPGGGWAFDYLGHCT